MYPIFIFPLVYSTVFFFLSYLVSPCLKICFSLEYWYLQKKRAVCNLIKRMDSIGHVYQEHFLLQIKLFLYTNANKYSILSKYNERKFFLKILLRLLICLNWLIVFSKPNISRQRAYRQPFSRALTGRRLSL
jgi:hypothetical protein